MDCSATRCTCRAYGRHAAAAACPSPRHRRTPAQPARLQHREVHEHAAAPGQIAVVTMPVRAPTACRAAAPTRAPARCTGVMVRRPARGRCRRTGQRPAPASARDGTPAARAAPPARPRSITCSPGTEGDERRRLCSACHLKATQAQAAAARAAARSATLSAASASAGAHTVADADARQRWAAPRDGGTGAVAPTALPAGAGTAGRSTPPSAARQGGGGPVPALRAGSVTRRRAKRAEFDRFRGVA